MSVAAPAALAGEEKSLKDEQGGEIMNMGKRYARRLLISGLAACLAFAGQAEARQYGAVEAGDTAGLHFTCRLRGGEVAISTTEAVNKDAFVPKAAIFLPRTTYAALDVKAGGEGPRPDGRVRGFEEEIFEGLAKAAVGMREGESRTVELKGDAAAGAKAAPAVVQLAKVRVRPKEYTMKTGDYRIRTGKMPEVGQAFSVDPLFPGKIVSVSEEEVLIAYAAQPGSTVTTPLGKATIREEGRNYLVEIDAKRGDLVRSGAMIGRVANVDDRAITVDYGHPFGYETLLCDVKVETIKKK